MDFPHQQESDGAIFSTCLFYVFLTLVVPVAAFFASRNILFETVLGIDTNTSTLYAAIVAVIVVHLSLGAYVVRAFREPAKGVKKD